MTKKAINIRSLRFSIHKYFTMYFSFFFYPRHLPTPTPTTHTQDPRPPPTTHDRRHLATLHISWLYTKLSVARSRRPSQLVCQGFLVWRPLKILPAGEQTDHYLKGREKGLSKWGKAFFKFYWPSSLCSAFHFFLFSSHLIPSLWLFLRSEVVLFPNFTNCWRGEIFC